MRTLIEELVKIDTEVVNKETIEKFEKAVGFNVKFNGPSGYYPNLYWFTICYCDGKADVYVKMEEYE